MEGCLAGRKAVAISFPFFKGWNNWTPEEVDTSVKVCKQTKLLWLWLEGVALLLGELIQTSNRYGTEQNCVMASPPMARRGQSPRQNAAGTSRNVVLC